ncbi:TetR/AcrR family transcriptional regulator [Corynebacterium nasicanis]|uniref:TetR/AcrR family transcriptional regulator n=1 Tax=Corynebacterium nasicanis TaxID=1448267 RepID=A0ABW1Q8A6_9CORY
MTSRDMPPERRRRRRTTQSGAVLDEKTIVDTALRLLREGGQEGLSTRRLGRALGADHTAIYRYFRNMNELELALADELIARGTSTWHATGVWYEDLERWGLSAHAVYMDNPAAAQIAATRITGGDPELAGVEAIVSLLRDAGFPPGHAVMFYELFISQLLAYARWDSAKKLLPEEERKRDISRWKDIYGTVSPEDYPAITANVNVVGGLAGLDTYPRTLRILLATMRATLAELRDRP